MQHNLEVSCKPFFSGCSKYHLSSQYNATHLLLGTTGHPTKYPDQGRSINAYEHGLPVVGVRVETATNQLARYTSIYLVIPDTIDN